MRATEDAERSAARLLALGYASFVVPATMGRDARRDPALRYDAVVATSAKAFDLLTRIFARRDPRPAAVRRRRADRASRHRAGTRGRSFREGRGGAGGALRARLTPASSRPLSRRPRPNERSRERARRVRPSRDADRGLRRGGSPRLEPRGSAARWRIATRRCIIRPGAPNSRCGSRRAPGSPIAFRALLHVCISEDAASPLRSSGATRVRSASSPDEDALFDALARAFGADD